jgi:oligosaccharide repeat unit polymerase
MFLLLTVVLIINLIIFSKIRIGSYNNPLAYYLIWWGIWLIVSQFNFFNLFEVSIKTYIFLLLNIFMFSLGYFIFCKKIQYKSFKIFKVNKEGIFIIQSTLFFILIYYLHRYNMLYRNASVLDIRNIKFQVGLLFSSGYEMIFFNYIITFLVYYFTLLSISRFIIEVKVDKNFYISVINVIIYSFIGYGRLIYFDFIIFIIVGFLLNKSLSRKKVNMYKLHNKKNMKNMIIFLIIIISGLLLSSYFISVRMGGNKVYKGLLNNFSQSIIYFTGPFRAFDNCMVTFSDKFNFTFGRSTLSGLDEIVNNMLYILYRNITPLNYEIGFYTQQPIMIGNHQIFNAFYTCIMNYYMDFGVIGVIIIPFIYGIIAAKIYRVFNDNPNIYTLMLIIYFTYTTISSEFRWSYQSPTTWIILIFILIGVHKHKAVNENIN